VSACVGTVAMPRDPTDWIGSGWSKTPRNGSGSLRYTRM
jgi:hypothetical protein